MCIVFNIFLNNFSAGHTSLLRSTDVTVAEYTFHSTPFNFRPFVPHSPTIHNAGIPILSVNAGYYCTETLEFFSRPGVFTTVEPRSSGLRWVKKVGRINGMTVLSGQTQISVRAVMTNTPYIAFAFLEQLISLINNRNVDIAYSN